MGFPFTLAVLRYDMDTSPKRNPCLGVLREGITTSVQMHFLFFFLPLFFLSFFFKKKKNATFVELSDKPQQMVESLLHPLPPTTTTTTTEALPRDPRCFTATCTYVNLKSAVSVRRLRLATSEENQTRQLSPLTPHYPRSGLALSY